MHLIQNRWYAALSSAELRREPIARRRFGLDLVFWRDERGEPAVARDRCPHRRAKLSLGEVVDGKIECPFHGFTYDREGACRSIPAHPDRTIPRAMCLDTLPIREAHGLIWLFTGPDAATDDPIPFFDFAGYEWAGSEMSEPVDVHYTVAIENQLDFAHLPFVHNKTIGRFVPSPAMDVETAVEGDRIRARAKETDGGIDFLGPNIWRLDLGRMWQFLAFVPVDENRTLYYIRSYQKTVTLPGLAWLFGRLQRFGNRYILREDNAVVETIPAGETRLRGLGEVLVPSDGPIIAYRRWREAHRGPFDPFGRREDDLVAVSALTKHAEEPLERAG
jgi:phenylpropionate dioxygenase-like ring-hydroxylating dioxygenase large terminal subunit